MKKLLLVLSGLLIGMTTLMAQGSSAFGVKGGLSIGVQDWNDLQQDPLFGYHGAVYIETYEEEEPFAIFAQLGYHQRGSALRNRQFFNINNGQPFRLDATNFQFNNIALILGGKRKYPYGTGFNQVYYLLGIRGEYTFSTNLEEYRAFNERNPTASIYPFPEGVRRLNYGVTVGGGFEFMFQELVGGFVELSIHPDFSRQYEQPPLGNIIDPYTGQTRALPERLIRNLSFELSVGIRLIRKVEYID
ncbi:MAG: hypothetical protein AB8G22_26695 [Saprospiraceae bacterium]